VQEREAQIQLQKEIEERKRAAEAAEHEASNAVHLHCAFARSHALNMELFFWEAFARSLFPLFCATLPCVYSALASTRFRCSPLCSA